MASEEAAGTEVLAAVTAGPAVVVADLTATTFIDSCALRLLLHAHREAASYGTDLRCAVSHPAVLQVIEITGADQILHIYPTVAAALAPKPLV